MLSGAGGGLKQVSKIIPIRIKPVNKIVTEQAFEKLRTFAARCRRTVGQGAGRNARWSERLAKGRLLKINFFLFKGLERKKIIVAREGE